MIFVFLFLPSPNMIISRSIYFFEPLFGGWGKNTYDQPRQHIKKQRHYLANKGLSSQGYGFSSGHVWM